MYKDSNVEVQPEIDFVAHAASMGAHAEKAADIADLEARIVAARGRAIPSVIVIDTEAVSGTGAGGHWWDVAVPQVGGPERLEKARERYDANAAASASSTDASWTPPHRRTTDAAASPQALRHPRQGARDHPGLGRLALRRLLALPAARRARPSAEATGDTRGDPRHGRGQGRLHGGGTGLGRSRRADGRLREDPAALPLPAERHRLDGHRRDRLRHRRLLGPGQGRPRARGGSARTASP